jgi:dolichol-phosphate mannosyltransferase
MGVDRLLDVSIVLPTYNESASLPRLIPRIASALDAAGIAGEVIVVDDDSPDNTAEIAKELGAQYPVRVLKRTTERGLATAVIAGFRMSEAQVCVVMDADGSHPVEALGEMVKTILSDRAEIVVGSRHVAGGGSKDWPLFSQLKSRFAASLAIGLTSMTDPTTGFMAIRRGLLEKLQLDPVGWKIVLETVVKAHPARLAEVPIIFTDRQAGESKQSLRVLGQYLRHLYKLYAFRFPSLIELLKFCLVGFLGLFVDLSLVTTIKQAFGLDTRLCQVFGFAAAVTFNYAINRRYSFAHARDTPLLSSYFTYVGTNLIGLTLRMLVIHVLMVLTALDQGRGYLLLSVIGIFLATLVNFVGAKYFAFAPPRPPAPPDVLDSLSPNLLARPSSQSAWILLVLGTALVCAANLKNPLAPLPDEIVNGIMADNIAESFQGLVHPSVQPGVPTDWQRDALPALGNTPVFPLLLAGFTQLGALGLALYPALIFAAFLLACLAAIKSLDRAAAHATVLLTASAPWLCAQFALLEFEPLVATWAALGFALLVRSEGKGRSALAFSAGLATGLGFATKMWLVLPGLFACFSYLLVRTYEGASVERSLWARASVLFGVGFALGAGSHLMFVAATAPQDLQAWLDTVYFGLFSGRGPSGPKLSAGMAKSSWAYVQWFVRDHGALLVPMVMGLPAVTRRLSVARQAWLLAVFGAFLAMIPLSIPASKEPLYMAPVLPFAYGFAGLAMIAPDRAPPLYRRVNMGAARLSLSIAGVLALGWIVSAVVAGPSLNVALHLAHIGIWCVPSARVLVRKPVAQSVAPCALASFALATILTLTGTRGLAP